MKSSNFKKYFIEITSYLFLLLFTYAAFSKVTTYETFVVQLGQSPLLSAFAGPVSIFIPGIEIVIAIMFMFRKTQFFALNASFVLMAMFTAYIFIILNLSDYVPCSCGGILEKMSWSEHLYFNIVFCFLALLAVIFSLQLLPLQEKQWKTNYKVIILLVISFFSVASVYLLFLRSEQIIHEENNFVRRYPPHLYDRLPEITLNYAGYYFAGATNDTIYFGNYRAPLVVLAISSDLNSSRQHKIKLSNYNLPFRAVTVKVKENEFFLSDGSLPALFVGSTKDWKAKQVEIPNKRFSAFEPIGGSKAVIRGKKPKSKESYLGLLDFSNRKSTIWNGDILQKQIDGIFDCDGVLSYNSQIQKVIYTYYYRNQFSVSSDKLALEFRKNTIDTTTKANIKVVKLSNGDLKMAKPPLIVNRLISSAGRQLFINSALRGHYESLKMWKQATPVDVYNLETKQYQYSFQVYNINDKKPDAMYATTDIVYFLFDRTLIAYKIDRKVLK
ncbi:MauE/DoxX family redox-associated membrane protein [Flavobacterium sp.]